jgi:4-amino-4-deoxy-L-arabinose transferase-like glycosyltransferase
MHAGWRIYAIWACCAARLAFYAAMLPLWEGFDEWAHFSTIRAMAGGHGALAPRDASVPRDVAESLNLAPVAWELRQYPPPAVTQDAFWTLPAEERQRRETAFRDMPAAWRTERGPQSPTAYEALQPPLYYWLMAPVARLLAGRSLAAQVLAIRWLSALVASLVIPLVYLVARAVFADIRIALGCAAVAALMPEWALDVARVGNDCLSAVFFAGVLWLGLKLLEEGPRLRWAAALGLALGLGLLTKAWFLTAAPAAALPFLWLARGGRIAQAARAGALTAGIAVAISGWWYARNLAETGTLSGLSEAVMLRHAGAAEMASGALRVPWIRAIDSILFSHLYFGGWSSLEVRSWMYHLFYVVILLAAIGLGRMSRWPRRAAVAWLLAVYLAFWAGQLYNVVLIHLSKGVPTSMGWYLYAVVAAEVVLAVTGLRAILPEKAGNWPVAGGVLLFGLLDLYTMHAVAIPYYTGMIRHKVSGALGALHAADFQAVGFSEAARRLTVFKGGVVTEPVVVALWAAYLLGTAALLAAGWRLSRRNILR